MNGQDALRLPGDHWLGRQPPAFREAVAAMASIEKIESGTPLWNMGDRVSSVVGIIEGCVMMSWATPQKQVSLLHLMWPGDWIGEVAVITGHSTVTSTVARMPARIARIEGPRLRSLLDEHPEWWRCLAQLSTEHLIMTGDSIEDLMLRHPTSRCIAVLLRNAGSRIQVSTPPRSSLVPISQEELAILANLHRNSVGKVLRDLADERLIARRYRAIELLDVEALRERLVSESDATEDW